MTEFVQKKCPTCGGRLELLLGRTYRCRCCRNEYEVNERNANLYHDLEVASVFRESANFKQAESLYKNMLKQYKEDDLSDVYWNLLLCEQRMMFETDQNGEQFPSFYDVVPTGIDESEYFSKAIEYAGRWGGGKAETFELLAGKMRTAKRKYRTIKNGTKPYDIFICFKKSKFEGGETEELELATELYNELGKTYNVFYSERSLRDIVVNEYEPNIYHALYTAKIMLVLCSRREYLESQWVKNEWSRFKMMSDTYSDDKRIVPIFMRGFAPENLPDELRRCQGYAANISLLDTLLRTAKAILNPTDKNAEIAASIKADMEAKFFAQFEAIQKQLAEQSARQAYQAPVKPVAPKPVEPQKPVADPKSIAQSTPVTPPKPRYIVPEGTKEIKADQKDPFRYINITTAIIPDSVTSIGNSVFSGCNGLTSITIPNSVTSIRHSAFAYCTGLTSLTMGNGVTSIDSSAFSGCSGLTSIIVAKGNTKYHSAGNCIIETKSKTLILGCKTSVIPTDGSVTSIGNSAFYDCSGLTSITIPNSVTSIGDSAFFGCSGPTSITIPDSVTSIGDNVFESCSGLTSITIPDSVTSIGCDAFYDCDNITTATIPAFAIGAIPKNKLQTAIITSGDSIPQSAFQYCDSLKSVTLGQGVKYIDKNAFAECRNLKDIHYKGTVAEWQCIKKAEGLFGRWDKNTPNYVVHCTNGELRQ